MVVVQRSREGEILAAAAELFAAHGYAAVGLGDIGRAVGLTGPALYRYFPSKEAILSAVVTSATDPVIEAMSVFAAGDDTVDAEAAVLQAVSIALDNRAGMATMFREASRLPEEVGAQALQAGERIGELATRAMRLYNPELDDISVTMRAMGSNSLVVRVTTAEVDVPRPRLDQIVASSAIALFRVPQLPTDESYRRPARWGPPPTRRDTILAAALGLFRERSFHDVGVDEIAAAAQMPTRALYRHFRNKQDILVEAYERADRLVGAALELGLEGAATAPDAVAGLARRVTAFAVRHPDLALVTSREDKALPPAEQGRFRAGADLVGVWGLALAEARPALPPPEARLLAATALTLVYTVAAAVPDHPDRAPEIAALAQAHLAV